jgi:3-hydroxyacyl-[acyl-carrier-protein] dehydratase
MAEKLKKNLEISEILELLPHRYPFLLVDRVLEIDPEREYIKAIKNVSINEPYFQGHFPGYPIMPGVLILEAMAQTGGLYLKHVFPEFREKLFVFAGANKVKFKAPVYPGDTLVIEAQGFKKKGHIVKTTVIAKVGDKVVAEAEITAAMR